MNKYVKGRRLEYKIMNLLRKHGFVAMRTAGSHGFADVIGVKNKHIILIQCKNAILSKKEIGDILREATAIYDNFYLISKTKKDKYVVSYLYGNSDDIIEEGLAEWMR